MIKRKVAAALVGLSVAMFGAASGAYAQGKELVVALSLIHIYSEREGDAFHEGFS